MARRHGWIAAVAGFVAYEVALHAAAQHPDTQVAALCLGAAPFLLIALAAACRHLGRLGWPALAALATACVGLWAARDALSHYFGWTYFLQHAGANAGLALMFGTTLRRGQTPLCAQFAAAMRGPLPPHAARYTRRVTQAWTLFFAGTAFVSAVLFAVAPMAVWSDFANLATPLLVALMFIAEATCRRAALPELAGGGVMEAIRGYQAVMADRATSASRRHGS
jgi:uncharacterized membrane protein